MMDSVLFAVGYILDSIFVFIMYSEPEIIKVCCVFCIICSNLYYILLTMYYIMCVLHTSFRARYSEQVPESDSMCYIPYTIYYMPGTVRLVNSEQVPESAAQALHPLQLH